MVKRIVTDHRRRLDPTTMCDLLSAKNNIVNLVLIIAILIQLIFSDVKMATCRSLCKTLNLTTSLHSDLQ